MATVRACYDGSGPTHQRRQAKLLYFLQDFRGAPEVDALTPEVDSFHFQEGSL